MSDDELSINIKEMLLRIEASLKDEITGLKTQVSLFQDKALTRAEHDKSMDHIYKELSRIEARVDKTHDHWKEELSALKQDLKDGQMKLIAAAGLIFTIVNFFVTYMIL